MHPTDTLLSLSQARIARAAAAGPRRATQPTLNTDRQHLARVEQGRTATGGGYITLRLSSCAEMNRRLISHIEDLARADGILAQRINAL